MGGPRGGWVGSTRACVPTDHSQSLRRQRELEVAELSFLFEIFRQAGNVIAEVHDELATVVLLRHRTPSRRYCCTGGTFISLVHAANKHRPRSQNRACFCRSPSSDNGCINSFNRCARTQMFHIIVRGNSRLARSSKYVATDACLTSSQQSPRHSTMSTTNLPRLSRGEHETRMRLCIGVSNGGGKKRDE